MSFFRKRQPSQTAPVAVIQPSAPLSNGHQTRDIPVPSEALKMAQQSQVLNQRVAAEDRLSAVSIVLISTSSDYARSRDKYLDFE